MAQKVKSKIQKIHSLISSLDTKYGLLLGYFIRDPFTHIFATLATTRVLSGAIELFEEIMFTEESLRIVFEELVTDYIKHVSGEDLNKIFGRYYKMIQGNKKRFFNLVSFDKNKPINESSLIRFTGQYAHLKDIIIELIYKLHNVSEKTFTEINQFKSLISRKGRGVEEDNYGNIPRKYL